MLKIQKPTLLLNEKICRDNIRRMAQKAHDKGLVLRPHFKTAQSVAIGAWFREAGIDKITVSSLQMAVYFANAGWKDITVAFPVNILEIQTINSLAQNRVQLQLLLDEDTPVRQLEAGLENAVNVFVKIDCGAGRTGFDPEDHEAINKMLNFLKTASKLNFKGFLTHAGQSYRCRSETEILGVHQHTKSIMSTLRERYCQIFPELIISVGDTPTASVATDWSGIDEIRPGNFTFYDLMQLQIASCSFEDIALSMLCPVVSKHKKRNEIVIYGGAVHFSKDFILEDKVPNFGLVRKYGEIEMPKHFLKSLSQEHGIISCSADFFDNINVGDVVEVFPVHSCLTADNMAVYYDKNGKKYDHFGMLKNL